MKKAEEDITANRKIGRNGARHLWTLHGDTKDS